MNWLKTKQNYLASDTNIPTYSEVSIKFSTYSNSHLQSSLLEPNEQLIKFLSFNDYHVRINRQETQYKNVQNHTQQSHTFDLKVTHSHSL